MGSFLRFITEIGQLLTAVFGQVGIAVIIAVCAAALAALFAANKGDRRLAFTATGVVVGIIAMIVTGITGGVVGHNGIVRDAGYEVTDDLQVDYGDRPPLAVCRERLAESLGNLAGEPMRDSVNYFVDADGPACSMVVDQRTMRQGLAGVVVWRYDAGDSLDRCEASSLPAWQGWFSNSLRAELVATKGGRSVSDDDIIGRCVDGKVDLTIPATRQAGTGRFTYKVHGGVYRVVEGDHGYEVTYLASGDGDTLGFLAAFTPASLSAKTVAGHRNATPELNWVRNAGFICPQDQRVFEAVSAPETEGESGVGIDGNISEFTLAREDGSSMDVVTPMTRCGSSQSLVGVAVQSVSSFEAGKLQPTTLHLRESAMPPLAQIAQSTVARVPEVATSNRLLIHEVTPTSHDSWTVLVGTQSQLAYRVEVPASGQVTVTRVGDVGQELDDTDVDEDVPAGAGTSGDTAGSGSDQQVLDELAGLRSEVEDLTEQIARLTDALEAQQADAAGDEQR